MKHRVPGVPGWEMQGGCRWAQSWLAGLAVFSTLRPRPAEVFKGGSGLPERACSSLYQEKPGGSDTQLWKLAVGAFPEA